MKMKPEPEEQQHHDQDLEVIKAVAQAWYSHSGSSRSASDSSEFDARRRNFRGKPSRFKLEALNKSSSSSTTTMVTTSHATNDWDFKQSLWDPYELVTVSRRIETGLSIDEPFDEFLCCSPRIQPRGSKLESKNSLRSLFKHSRRFIASKIAKENDT